MTDVGLTAHLQELSTALQRRATFVQRPDYKAQISYVADLLDRSVRDLQTTPSQPYQPATPLGAKLNLVV
jgi:hypothetical protein